MQMRKEDNRMSVYVIAQGKIENRGLTEREKRLLEVIGEDVMEEIKRRNSVGSPSVLVAEAVITDAT
jgi:hypothetical protein